MPAVVAIGSYNRKESHLKTHCCDLFTRKK